MEWALQQPAGAWAAVWLSVFHATLFVALIYAFMIVRPVADVSIHSRNHPLIIRRRIWGVFAATTVSLAATAYVLTNGSTADPVVAQLGLRPAMAPGSAVVGAVLTLTLFMGPLVLDYLDGAFEWAAICAFLATLASSIQRQRDVLVGPVAEELVFRAAVVPVWLAAGISPPVCVFASPVLFGLAHIHQAFMRLSSGSHTVAQVLVSTAVQLAYTTVFGWFAAALFVRTHSVAGPLVAHIVCNIQGFPDLSRANGYPRAKYAIWLAFVLGLLGFALLFEPMTRPGVFVVAI
ncbi:CAAX prenyl protease [Coemansia spiralis]|uniref:intramembrane prenyl-peptidase Rce1 n=2 Tax=Coemansia TaxID=4863 RepID=A0A9W8L0Z8_9FUNG|nr:hypothetical protein BX070DRAFT_228473 [Coemansia spiralis]KAJ1996050.1 CAAX prenyl protease [Coemansia umbellata]KAJ2625491.1 CAAX prenyl protease [Coemansia sp. RSA 1358]KAJ2680616.1 CAAX prenyl protease [Coemansia spiralis]